MHFKFPKFETKLEIAYLKIAFIGHSFFSSEII